MLNELEQHRGNGNGHNGRAKLNFSIAERIREMRRSGMPQREIAKVFGVGDETVRRIVNKLPRGGWVTP
jgi:DNA invertase Pin-like site-specific DNA recombinase